MYNIFDRCRAGKKIGVKHFDTFQKKSAWWFSDSRTEWKRHEEQAGSYGGQSTCRTTTEFVLHAEECRGAFAWHRDSHLYFHFWKIKNFFLGRWNYKSEVRSTGWHTKTDMRHVFRALHVKSDMVPIEHRFRSTNDTRSFFVSKNIVWSIDCFLQLVCWGWAPDKTGRRWTQKRKVWF